jgi:hypothetical protein
MLFQTSAVSLKALPVKIIQKSEELDLLVNGKPFFNKGVVGNSCPEKIKYCAQNNYNRQ